MVSLLAEVTEHRDEGCPELFREGILYHCRAFYMWHVLC